MRTIIVTGSASGIGRAAMERLAASGARVIGVDLKDADIIADLTTAGGRAAMLDAAGRLAREGLDGVVAAAGIGAPDRPAEIIAVNYFGAVATLEGLRPLLARRRSARAVAIGSTAALLPTDTTTVKACLAGAEPEAIAAIRARAETAYMSSKLALSLWLRRAAISSAWAGSGVLLNGVAPGVVETAMTAPLFNDPAMIPLMAQSNPMAVENYAKPEEIAELIAYLLTFEGHYLVGQMIFIDGGTDAILRPDSI